MDESVPCGAATTAIHVGDTARTGTGLALPIDPSVAFLMQEGGPVYSRLAHPTGEACARALAALEGAQSCLLANSGMSAITGTLLALLQPGDHVLAPDSLYAATHTFLTQQLPQWGVSVTFVDARDAASYAREARPQTRLAWIETPSNPLLRLTDIEAVVAWARPAGVLTVADNTFATPLGSRPLALGVDIVIHSATKYLAGHGDLLAGAILTCEDLSARIAPWLAMLGTGLNAQGAFLLRRGLYTLQLRVERHNATALALARWLEARPDVKAVHYPGLASHPQHELARRQLPGGAGGVLSFELEDGEAARRLLARVRLCAPALSLGEARTLIAHPASFHYKALSQDQRLTLGVSDGLIRLAVGLEDPEDIIADLNQALQRG